MLRKLGKRKYMLRGFEEVLFMIPMQVEDSQVIAKELSNARKAARLIAEKGLSCLRVPRMSQFQVKKGDGEITVVAVELAETITGYWTSEARYEAYYSLFESEPVWRDAFAELFRQLAVFVCHIPLWDLKFDNVPLSEDGSSIWFVDLEYGDTGQKESSPEMDASRHLFYGGGNDGYEVAVPPASLFDEILAASASCLRSAPSAIISPEELLEAKKKRQDVFVNTKQFRSWLSRNQIALRQNFEIPPSLVITESELAIAKSLILKLNEELEHVLEGAQPYDDAQKIIHYRTFDHVGFCQIVKHGCFHMEEPAAQKVCEKVTPVLTKLKEANVFFSARCDARNRIMRIQG